MPLESSSLANFLSAFVILIGIQSAVFKYLTKIHLKHSLSSTFLKILINPYLEWCNSFGNFIKLLPVKGLYFEILIL